MEREKIDLDSKHINNISLNLSYETLKNKMRAVTDSYGFRYDDTTIKRIKDNRNKIVHEVRFTDYSKPFDDFLLIKLLIDKLFLKTLEYSGRVINYSNQNAVEKII